MPSRREFGVSEALAFYEGKDLAVSPGEKDALRDGDTMGFWASRVGKDPVARVGLSIWATKAQLARTIETTGVEHWRPQIEWLSTIGLVVSGYPEELTLHPKTKAELVEYWAWMGKTTRERVVQKAVDRGLLGCGFDSQNKGISELIDSTPAQELLRAIGQALARRHAVELQADRRHGLGMLPGLLSLSQVAKYHHEVFRSFGLPKTTYGGTPVSLGPLGLRLQLAVAGGLYAPDADPKD